MRFWAVLAMCAGTLLGKIAVAEPARQDISGLNIAQVSAIQRRLIDVQCYFGPADGIASPAFKTALATCPDQRPRLVIETGMHTGVIRGLAVNKSCKFAATAGSDKTLRLWSLPEGRLLKTLRIPIGENNLGKINALAMSPDGRLVATGGWDAREEVDGKSAVYVFDTASGSMVARLGNFDKIILDLSFAPDGHWLSVGLASGGGLVVYDTSLPDAAKWTQAAWDKNYTANIYAATFAADGRLFSGSYDGKLRLYSAGPAFRKIGEAATKSGKNPAKLAVDPRMERLAVGFVETGAVDLYDARDLHFLTTADGGIAGEINNLSAVAWSSDGSRLYAAGRRGVGNDHPVFIFDRNGHTASAPQPVGDDTAMVLAPCGVQTAVVTADPTFGLMDKDGGKVMWKRGSIADFRSMAGGFAVSPDGRRVRFGLKLRLGDPQMFDLGRAVLETAPAPGTAMLGAKTKGLPVLDWQDTSRPTFNGKPMEMETFETSRALAIANNQTGFVLATGWNIRNYRADGTLIWKRAVSGTAWSVNLTPDNKLIVSAHGDGTIRWHRASDGMELLALFVNTQTKAWVAWTPTGYYSASPGGEDMIGWHINRGWTQAADYFPADRFRSQFARPDVVDRVLATLDEAQALQQANAARPIKVEAKPLVDDLPPVISILSPGDGHVLEGNSITISYIIRSPSGTPVDAVEARVDGRPLPLGRTTGTSDAVRQCLVDTRGQGKIEGALQGCRGTITLDAPLASAEIGIAAKIGVRTSEAAILRVTRAAPLAAANPAASSVVKPKLYALIVGVADYVNPAYKLQLAAKDAGDFKAALDNQKGGLYSEVNVRLLTDRQATASTIRDGLDWLSRQTTARDVAVLYFAGHGEIDIRSNRFYILPSDADATRLFSTAISREDINAAMEQVPGKAIVFLDACHSGAVAGGQQTRGLGAFNVNDVIKDFANADNGLVLFTAATGKQLSLEDTAWGNGAFTKALVEGLGIQGTKARANVLNQGSITLSELDAYVSDRVKQLTNGAQSPVMINPKGVPNFPLALVR